MKFQGKLFKSEAHWLVEIPSLDLMAQGDTKIEALVNLNEIIFELLEYYHFNSGLNDLSVDVKRSNKDIIWLSFSNQELFLALSQRRLKEKHCLTNK